MNKGLKIFLLAFSVLLALGVTLIFLKTILDPPSPIGELDSFEKNLKEETELMKTLSTKASQDSLFHLVMDEVSFQHQESLLDDSKRDASLKRFLSTYTPMFNSGCDAFFHTGWTLADYKPLYARLTEIKACKASDGSPCYPEELVSSLSRTFDIVEKARGCYQVSKFTNVSSARQHISTASYCRGQFPVTQCTELVKGLEKVPSRIEANHYSQIQSLVKKLNSPSNYQGLDAVYPDINRANELINNYREMSYSNSRNVSGFESDISNAMSRAYNYFVYHSY